jgi:hypothetical protein
MHPGKIFPHIVISEHSDISTTVPWFLGSLVPGFPASRLPGFPASRLPGFPASRLPGFPASRLPGDDIFSRRAPDAKPVPMATIPGNYFVQFDCN